jgi:hypothetical protein
MKNWRNALMCLSSALQFDEQITEEAASIADLVPIVRARFVEAADTMFHIEVRNVRPGEPRSFWPETQREPMDEVEIILRHRPTASAISRAEEVLYGWLPEVASEADRVLLGKWSLCLAAPYKFGSFREYCSEKRLIRRTAERHILREFQRIADRTIKFAQSLQDPDWSRVSPMMPNSDTDFDIVRRPVKKHSSFDLMVKPAYDANDPEHAKLRAKLIRRLEKGNRERAKGGKPKTA